jgi:EmrB/QacA subfamily drug resistance transporter
MADVRESHGIELDTPEGRLLVATTVLGSAVVMITVTVVNVALPRIADDLDAGSAGQTWVVNAYLLTVASLILVGGALADRFGRLRVYRIGVAWFAIASLACAAAPTIEVLIAFRLLLGVGGALLIPGSLAIIEATLVPGDRGRGVGIWAGLSGVAGAIGPLVGGALVDASWRWVFVINVPIAVLVLVLSARLPESRDPSAQHARIDIVGAGLAVVGLGGITFAFVQGPSGGWSAADAVAGAVGVVAVVAAVVYEPRVDHAMVPVELFAIRPFTAANIITLLVYGGLGVTFFLLSIQLQVAVGWSPLAAGAALLPITVLMLLLSGRAGYVASRIGPRWPLTVGPLLMAAGLLLLVRVDAGATFVADVLPALVVFGLGLATSVAPVTSTALGSVPDERAGAASGTNNAVAQTGQLLAVAAVPSLVGLTGGALRDPAALDDHFSTAMMLAAALVAAGGAAAFVLLRSSDACPADPEQVPEFQCALAGSALAQSGTGAPE